MSTRDGIYGGVVFICTGLVWFVLGLAKSQDKHMIDFNAGVSLSIGIFSLLIGIIIFLLSLLRE